MSAQLCLVILLRIESVGPNVHLISVHKLWYGTYVTAYLFQLRCHQHEFNRLTDNSLT